MENEPKVVGVDSIQLKNPNIFTVFFEGLGIKVSM
jgi:hypothetical protein